MQVLTLNSYDNVNPTCLFGYDMYSAEKKKNLFHCRFTLKKTFFSSYCVIVDRPGEGTSEKNCSW